MKKRKAYIALLLVVTTLTLTIPTLAAEFTEDTWAALNENIVPNGVYYLRNISTDLYMQVDDNDDDNNFSSDGAHLEIHEGEYTLEQRWRISKLSGSYYIIISEASGLALTAGSFGRLVQKEYTGTENQQWTITRHSSNEYYFHSRASSNNEYMGIYYAFSPTGTNVREIRSTSLSNSEILWELFPIFDTVLLGHDVPNESYDRSAFLEPTAEHMRLRSDNIYTDYYQRYSVDQMLQCLHRCSVLYIHTHGLRNSFQLGYGPVVNLQMTDLVSYDLSHMDFVLLLTCYTAQGGYDQSRVNTNEPYNIVEQLVVCGVETVIGFKDTTHPEDCNWFAQRFTLTALTLYNRCEEHRDDDYNYCENCIYDILTIEEAVVASQGDDRYDEFFSLLEIGGNGNQYLA